MIILYALVSVCYVCKAAYLVHSDGSVNFETISNKSRSVDLMTRIVGGTEASILDFPWMVSLRMNGKHACGGSILNRNHVLTAAHCLNEVDLKSLTITAGSASLKDKKAFTSSVKKVVKHPKYLKSAEDYDAAILKLTKKLHLSKRIKPIRLPLKNVDPYGKTGVVTGWGFLSETNEATSNHLQKVSVGIVTNKECKKAETMKDKKITGRMICAGYLRGGKDACIKDSGGPLVWKTKGVAYQVGIVSWGTSCAAANSYGVYTRITSILDWIKKVSK